MLFSRFYWRPLIPGEHDPELTWGLVLACGSALGIGWLALGLPTPLCPLHALTGVPCPTCGMTRGLRCLLHGNVEAALLFNPLLILILVGLIIYLVYCMVVVAARLPRLRWEKSSQSTALGIRITVVMLLAVDWIYLIMRERALF